MNIALSLVLLIHSRRYASVEAAGTAFESCSPPPNVLRNWQSFQRTCHPD